MQKKTFLLLPLLGALAAYPALADVVGLKNGDRLTGTVEGFDGSVLTLSTDYTGTIRLPVDRIARVETDGPVTVRVDGIGWMTGRLVTDYSGTIRIVHEDRTSSAPMPLTAVERLHPGTDVPGRFAWRGRVEAGATERSGNTKSRAFRLATEVTGRSEKHRIRFRGVGNREFDSDGRRTVDNFTTSLQHDNFVSEKVFFYTSGRLERDRPADLRLRTTLGTGGGYQFIETETTKLSVQAGPAYVRENFATSPNDDYLALH